MSDVKEHVDVFSIAEVGSLEPLGVIDEADVLIFGRDFLVDLGGVGLAGSDERGGVEIVAGDFANL